MIKEWWFIKTSYISAMILEIETAKQVAKSLLQIKAIILNLDKKSQLVENFCNDMYLDFKENGIDIFYDDRDERPGIKFSDSDLLGIPFVIIVGKNFLNQRNVTVVDKYSNQEIEIPENEAVSKIKQMIKIYD